MTWSWPCPLPYLQKTPLQGSLCLRRPQHQLLLGFRYVTRYGGREGTSEMELITMDFPEDVLASMHRSWSKLIYRILFRLNLEQSLRLTTSLPPSHSLSLILTVATTENLSCFTPCQRTVPRTCSPSLHSHPPPISTPLRPH